jgi:CelD/BcsL family acetyltransferase involved in cellulose biosynthesis
VPEKPAFTILRTLEQLEALLPQWRSLWQEAAATPFQHPAWLLPWCRHFADRELRAVAVTDSGSLLALLPFYLCRDPLSGTRKLLLLGAGTSDYLDALVSAACTEETLYAAVDRALAEPGWDVLDMTQLLPDSRLLHAVADLNLPGLHPIASESTGRGPACPIAELPQKLRRHVMYYRNRATRLGALQYVTADDGNLQRYFLALCRMHTERWRQAQQSGVLADPRVLRWHNESLPALQRGGILRLGCLFLQGEPIAALYSLIDPPSRPERTQYFYLTAYSVRHAEMRAGTLLLAFAMKQAAAEGVRTIDMLRGEEDYKRLWSARSPGDSRCRPGVRIPSRSPHSRKKARGRGSHLRPDFSLRCYSPDLFEIWFVACFSRSASFSSAWETWSICVPASDHCFCSIASRTPGIVLTP